MQKKIKQIKFSNYNSEHEFLQFLIENEINELIDDNGNVFPYLDYLTIWEQNKNVDLKKFK